MVISTPVQNVISDLTKRGYTAPVTQEITSGNGRVVIRRSRTNAIAQEPVSQQVQGISPPVQNVINELEKQNLIKSYTIYKKETEEKGIYRPTRESFVQTPFRETIKTYSSLGGSAIEKAREFIISKSGKYRPQVSEFFYSGVDLTTMKPKRFSKEELRNEGEAVTEGVLFGASPLLFVGRGEETIVRQVMGKKDIQENIKGLTELEKQGQAFLPYEKEVVSYTEPIMDIGFGSLGIAGQLKAGETIERNLAIRQFEKSPTKIDVVRLQQGEEGFDIISFAKGEGDIKATGSLIQKFKSFEENPKFQENIGILESGEPAIKQSEFNLKDKIFLEEGKGRIKLIDTKTPDEFIYYEFESGGVIQQSKEAPLLLKKQKLTDPTDIRNKEAFNFLEDTSYRKSNQFDNTLLSETELTETTGGVGRIYTKTTGKVKGKITKSPSASFIDVGETDLRYFVELEKIDIGEPVKKYKTTGGIATESKFEGEENVLYGLGLDEISGSTGEIFRGKVSSKVRVRKIEVKESLIDSEIGEQATESFMFKRGSKKPNKPFELQNEDLPKSEIDLTSERLGQKQNIKQKSIPKSSATYYDGLISSALEDIIPKQTEIQKPKPITKTKLGELSKNKIKSRQLTSLGTEELFRDNISERYLTNVKVDSIEKSGIKEREIYGLKTEQKISQPQKEKKFNPLIDITFEPEFPKNEIPLPFAPKLKGRGRKKKTSRKSRRQEEIIYAEDFLGRVLGITRKVSKKQLLKESKGGDFGIGIREIPSLID